MVRRLLGEQLLLFLLVIDRIRMLFSCTGGKEKELGIEDASDNIEKSRTEI